MGAILATVATTIGVSTTTVAVGAAAVAGTGVGYGVKSRIDSKREKRNENKTQFELDREKRQSYLASKSLKTLKEIEQKMMIVERQNRNSENIISTIYNNLKAKYNALSNYQKRIGDNFNIEFIRQEIINDLDNINSVWDNLFNEFKPLFKFTWKIDGEVQENQVKVDFKIPNDNSLVNKIVTCEVLAYDGKRDNILINHSYRFEKTIKEYNLNKWFNCNPKIKRSYKKDEIDTFYNWLNGRGSLEAVYDVKNTYQEYLNTYNNSTVKKYQLVGLINFYDYLLNQLIELRNQIEDSVQYWKGKQGFFSWFAYYLPGSSSKVENLEKIKNTDINYLSSEIERKKSNLLNGSKNYKLFMDYYISTINHSDFLYPEKPDESPDENQASYSNYVNKCNYCNQFLDERKKHLNELLITLATVTGASAINNTTANGN